MSDECCGKPGCQLIPEYMSEHGITGSVTINGKWYCSKEHSDCTGLVFRAVESSYFDEKKLAFKHRESLTLLKRESCKCDECKQTLKDVTQNGHDYLDCVYWNKTIGVDHLNHGSKYRMVVDAWDSEDGYGCYVSEFHFEEVV